MARAAATSKPANIAFNDDRVPIHVSVSFSDVFAHFLDLGLISVELSFRAKRAHRIKTLYHSILLNWVGRGGRDEISDVQRCVRNRHETSAGSDAQRLSPIRRQRLYSETGPKERESFPCSLSALKTRRALVRREYGEQLGETGFVVIDRGDFPLASIQSGCCLRRASRICARSSA